MLDEPPPPVRPCHLSPTRCRRQAGRCRRRSDPFHRSELHLNERRDDLVALQRAWTLHLSRRSTSRRCRPSPASWSAPRASAPPTTSPDNSPPRPTCRARRHLGRISAPDASSGAGPLSSVVPPAGWVRRVSRRRPLSSVAPRRTRPAPGCRLDPTDPTATLLTCHPRPPTRPRPPRPDTNPVPGHHACPTTTAVAPSHRDERGGTHLHLCSARSGRPGIWHTAQDRLPNARQLHTPLSRGYGRVSSPSGGVHPRSSSIWSPRR